MLTDEARKRMGICVHRIDAIFVLELYGRNKDHRKLHVVRCRLCRVRGWAQSVGKARMHCLAKADAAAIKQLRSIRKKLLARIPEDA